MGFDFEAARQEVVPEERAGFGDDVPIGVWLLGTTPDNPESGWAPKQAEGQYKKGPKAGEAFYKFRTGFRVIGGEPKVDEKFAGRFVAFEAFIHPSTENGEDGLLSGRMTGFINTMFSSGVGSDLVTKGMAAEAKKAAERKRVELRLKNTFEALRQAEEQNALDVNEFDGDSGRFLVGCAVAALDSKPRVVLFKSVADNFKTADGTQVNRVKVGSFEDATPENLAARKVRWFDEREQVELGWPPVQAPPMQF
jgi:hypothetical protein